MDDPIDELDYLDRIRNPMARAAATSALWLQVAGNEPAEAGGHMPAMVSMVRELALESPQTRRMALTLMRSMADWDRRALAKVLGVSPVTYNLIELGQRPLSREDFLRLVTAQEVTDDQLDQVLLMTHAMVEEMETAWEMTWQEELAPLSHPERRARILKDPELRNWGLGELLCSKSLAAANVEDAVALAELALLVAEKVRYHRAASRRRFESYAWGHLGHALQRRGNQAAAETAFAECIELWKTGKRFEPEDRARAEKLATLVPGFPPQEPAQRKRKRKPKQAGQSKKRADL